MSNRPSAKAMTQEGEKYMVGGDGYETHLVASGKIIDGKACYFLSTYRCDKDQDCYNEANWYLAESKTFSTVKSLLLSVA